MSSLSWRPDYGLNYFTDTGLGNLMNTSQSLSTSGFSGSGFMCPSVDCWQDSQTAHSYKLYRLPRFSLSKISCGKIRPCDDVVTCGNISVCVINGCNKTCIKWEIYEASVHQKSLNEAVEPSQQNGGRCFPSTVGFNI